MSSHSDIHKEKELEQGPSDIDSQLRRVMSISPEIFEKLYLSPKNAVAGDLRKTFANPTPLGLMGFVIGLTPLSIEFMGWRGSGGNAVATTGATIWFGGAILFIAGILEFILGNTFPFVVFFGYGGHFLTLGTTFIPFYNAVGYYAPADNPTEITPQFAASFAFYALSLGILSFIFLICSFRTNAMFVIIFIAATIGFSMAAGGFWQIAQARAELSVKLFVGAGACFFAASMIGWYLLLALLLEAVEFPVPQLPVFDLSTIIKAKSKKE